MEKLQAALARAREKREQGGDEPDARGPRHAGSTRSRSQRRPAAGASGDDLVARWSALEEVAPTPRRMRQWRIFSTDAGRDAQHFDILRTKLLLEMRRHNWTRIAITSATPGCGKTTIACNLLAGMVRQPETRAILFDLDLRRPAVARFFGIERGASVADVLSGTESFANQAVRIAPNAAISVARGPVRDPAELASRQSVRETLDRIQADYQPDAMFFDLPPLLISDETRSLLGLVDATVIVAQAGLSTIAQIDDTERETAEYSQVAGVVLNKCRFGDDSYGYSY